MKKEIAVIVSYELSTFTKELSMYVKDGWTVATDSYRVCPTDCSNMYSILVQREVAEPHDVIAPTTPHDPGIDHEVGCSCYYCR